MAPQPTTLTQTNVKSTDACSHADHIHRHTEIDHQAPHLDTTIYPPCPRCCPAVSHSAVCVPFLRVFRRTRPQVYKANMYAHDAESTTVCA